MCGIAGRFHPVELTPDPAWRERADALLRHRGPDGRGGFADRRCELVHRRLALIDLSPTGAQPIGNEDGRVLVVCNGEIYNHRALRDWLVGRGHTFRGTSDCEVLPHLYEELGPGCVERLRGMFAFALYDAAAGRLLLARDRFGIKPLYYLSADGGHAFASEIKALLALPGVRPAIDRQACYDFLGFGFVPEPATAFRDIRALPAGTLLVSDASGTSLRRYYHLRAHPDAGLDARRVTDELEDRLTRAVRDQSMADVPVAALLSGGIDSSLVVAGHMRSLHNPIRTFNVRFQDEEFDETPYAHATAAHCRTEHETIPMSDGRVTLDEVLNLVAHFDQPFADTSLIPTERVSRAVRERGFICTLSGDGGDESFGGYTDFLRLPWLMRLSRAPRGMISALAFAAHGTGGVLPDLGRPAERAARLAAAADGDLRALIAGLSIYLSEAEKERLVLPDARSGLEPVRRLVPEPDNGASPREAAIACLTEYLFTVGLTSDMLRKVDMMSMLHGLEVRVPLLDEEVVDLGLRLPSRLKIAAGEGKVALRALAARWLPDTVVKHRKMGFRAPVDRLLPAGTGGILRDHLLASDSPTRTFLDAREVGRFIDLFERSQRGDANRDISREGLGQRIVFLLALDAWMRRHRLSW